MKKIKALAVIAAAGIMAVSMSVTGFAANVMTAAQFQAAYPQLAVSNPVVSMMVAAVGGGATTGIGSFGGSNATADGFNAAEYAEMYPDVVAVVGMDPAALYQHYMMHGRLEGRFVSKAAKAQADKASGKSSSPYDRFNTYGRTSAPGSSGKTTTSESSNSGSSNSASSNK